MIVGATLVVACALNLAGAEWAYLPPASELLPFVVAVDGNPEDGYGGYVLGCADGDRAYEQKTDAFVATGTDAFALTFYGTWLAVYRRWHARPRISFQRRMR